LILDNRGSKPSFEREDILNESSPSGIIIFDTKSLFVYTLNTGIFTCETISRIYFSSSPHSLEESIKYKTSSASLSEDIA